MSPIGARIFTLAAVVLVGCACSRDPIAADRTAPATTRASGAERPRYDDPSFSRNERRAVRAATEVVLDPNHPRPDFDQTFRYGVFRCENGDWIVTVWRIAGWMNGSPLLVPGGLTDVMRDASFKVKDTLPGT